MVRYGNNLNTPYGAIPFMELSEILTLFIATSCQRGSLVAEDRIYNDSN